MKRPIALSVRLDSLAVPAGLIVAQVVAFGAVRQSNLQVHQDAILMQAAGWLAIPTGSALDMLPTMKAAFAGALFFTLTCGAGLALAGWGMVRLQRMCSSCHRLWYGWPVAAAAVAVILVNSRGFVWFPSLLTASVLLTSGLMAGFSPAPPRAHSRWWLALVVLALLTGLWATQLNRGLFTTIRDHLLLSNTVGSKINDFYYRNTLYAAELFKSFGQKSLRTCRLEGPFDPSGAQRLTAVLTQRDVLVLPGNAPVDLTIRLAQAPFNGNPPDSLDVTLISRHGRSVRADLADLTADPGPWLTRISDLDDHYAPFRRMTLLGLLIGFPVLLYWAAYCLILWAVGLFTPRWAAEWAAGICLIIGIVLFIPVFSGRPVPVAAGNIDAVLKTGPWTRRVAAMQIIEKEKLEIDAYPSYRELLHHSTPVERYYLARVLAQSHAAGTYEDLTAMIDDPHPNVVCQVFYALGRRGQSSAAALIKNRIMQSDHWYVQWYGYRALRNLGWRQKQYVSPL